MNAREYAWNVLNRIQNEHGYASLILRARKEVFNEADSALISELVYGTLRNLTYLEYQWQDLARGRVRPKTAMLLNMSVYQLQILTKIPSYAAVDQAVQMAENNEKQFVNAVLHAVIKRGIRKIDTGDEIKDLSIRTSHPEWLLHLWTAHYGKETAARIAESDQQAGKVYGRINRLKKQKEDLEKEPGIHFLEDDCFSYDGILSSTEWFRNGEVLIQDRSSQRVVYSLDLHPGMNVLDLCAAPGTKSQQMAVLMQDRGSILACDLYPARTSLIEQLMQRTGVHICQTQASDACHADTAHAHESYDRILADVPCSGLGDLRHKPEIRMHVTPRDLDELCHLQQRILNASADLLKKGGKMVYSTCTLNRKENENQIAGFLKRHPDYSLLQEKTLFPFEFSSDGFYEALLVRNA